MNPEPINCSACGRSVSFELHLEHSPSDDNFFYIVTHTCCGAEYVVAIVDNEVRQPHDILGMLEKIEEKQWP